MSLDLNEYTFWSSIGTRSIHENVKQETNKYHTISNISIFPERMIANNVRKKTFIKVNRCFAQDCSNSIANALELLQSCTK